jgi:hypothetical protein
MKRTIAAPWAAALMVALSNHSASAAEGTNSGAAVSWNDPSLVMVQGPWAKEPGMDRVQSFVMDQVDPKGREYAADLKKWVSFLVRPEFLPEGFESNAIPVRMGYLPVVGLANPSNSVPGKDGFIVRYVMGGYAVQLADTWYDLRILVRDLGTNVAGQTYQEKVEAGERIMRLFLRSEIVQYPDGTNRNLRYVDFGNHVYGSWNWQVKEKQKDDPDIASTSSARPYVAFAVWRSDGESVLICFEKSYFLSSSPPPWRTSRASRFGKAAAFHDMDTLGRVPMGL